MDETSNGAARIAVLPAAQHLEVAEVLCDAFFDYPVMRHVVGDHTDYDRRLQRLVEFFVFRRVRQGALLYGISRGDRLLGAAVLATPRETTSPPDVKDLAAQLWAAIGDDARERMDRYAEATSGFTIADPHHHLSMIGVRRDHHGEKLARPLLDVVRQTSVDDPASHGVSLTTELERNVRLYEHFGYAVYGHERVTDTMATWGLFLRTRASP